MLTKETYQRYSRQLLVDPFNDLAQQQLIHSSVLIVGAGGLGCAAAQYLVGSGVGHLLLMDHDKVDISNLHRQPLYVESDVGSYKAESAARRLLQINSTGRISALTYQADEAVLETFIPLVDIVLDCTDNLPTRFIINSLSYKHKKPLFIGAATGSLAQFVALNPAQNHGCYACLYAPEQDTGNSCLSQGILGPVVALAGNYQALASLYYLSGSNQLDWGRLHVFDGSKMQWKQFAIPKRSECAVCGDK
ncbi:HesA/MoeB/ThiF family protein [Alteromonas sp. ASW11-130]|uniref:HesA/MoeB/ThiF family protein n=1 Tax=Alteromonas sp. ASW11-130 TaxID=3015775 RepID=UPI00224197AE|nr:HesA/MoeB/ThiF family protein [Alteromonas sp. ASW11-130]MCW8091120.1 HesA/MoeB/ThiF family protein [Alteromonas sp. ASW11-130]